MKLKAVSFQKAVQLGLGNTQSQVVASEKVGLQFDAGFVAITHKDGRTLVPLANVVAMTPDEEKPAAVKK